MQARIMPEQVEIIDIPNSTWNCDKCIFFNAEKFECISFKRLLFSEALRDNCNDCTRPFVLKSVTEEELTINNL
jgi:hypothetical protein